MALLGKQKDLDKNKDGEISGEDFAMLREQRMSGGLLDDDMMRVGYADRGLVGPEEMEYPNFGFNQDYLNKDIAKGIIKHSKHMANYAEKYSNPEEREKYINEHIVNVAKNLKRAGNLNEETMRSEFEKQLSVYNLGQDNEREQKAEGGEMLPDEMMEQNFVDFVMSEALSPEEKSMLEEQLEANPELSIMFDKVVETASEFTGAGPVEGPGTGTSDDIPARLSDGEFVFTAKAVEQIGADNLMQMMKDAEAVYDAGGEREAMQEGGMPSDTEKVEVEYTINRPADAAVSGVTPLLAEQEQEDMMDEEIKKSMLGLTPYVRS